MEHALRLVQIIPPVSYFQFFHVLVSQAAPSYVHLMFHMCATRTAHYITLNVIALIILGEECLRITNLLSVSGLLSPSPLLNRSHSHSPKNSILKPPLCPKQQF